MTCHGVRADSYDSKLALVILRIALQVLPVHDIRLHFRARHFRTLSNKINKAMPDTLQVPSVRIISRVVATLVWPVRSPYLSPMKTICGLVDH